MFILCTKYVEICIKKSIISSDVTSSYLLKACANIKYVTFQNFNSFTSEPNLQHYIGGNDEHV